MTAENNGLKAENAELRKERDFYCNQVIENGGRAQRAIDALNDENAKLRDLVKALLTCATDGDCDECRLNGATPWHVGKAQLCDGVWDRMRELGVEVD